jgi:8-oxo-dGTP pyrophosphatase MutT (NUDIX family)
MSISISGHKLRINLTIPLPGKYRGGGVAVFRINNGQPEVLLGLRANNPGKGLWTFPGGGAEGQEKLSTAAVREFREETGVQLYGRYIAKTGLFTIKNAFFEWNTLIIESTQNISIKSLRNNYSKDWGLIGGEFISLRWIPLSEIANYKLHRWVMNVVDFYLSGKMKSYTAKSPKDGVRALPKPKQANRAKSVRRESGESLLFDMAEMVLTKVGRDGTKYFQPSYQINGKKSSIIQEALYGV